MIASIEGTLVDHGADRAVIDVGGIGYEVIVPVRVLADLPARGRKVRLHTRLQVRDDSLVLYGFASSDERSMFDHLVTVTGVGPKMAIAVLSVLSPEEIRRAIGADDGAALTMVPGVGKKVAARILLDLRDKLGAGPPEAGTGPISEVREALLALGLSPAEAREALAGVQAEDGKPVEELLREALRGVRR